jgi:TrmH family RNA methyltransferase
VSNHPISHSRHPLLKLLRSLRQGDHGDDQILVEGPHLLGEAVASGYEVSQVLVTTRARERPAIQRLLERIPLAAQSEVAEELLDRLADADSPRGLVAILKAPALPPSREGSSSNERRLVLLDGVQDPGNLGALARVAEATGTTRLLLLPGTCRWSHPRALRASAGSLLRLPTSRHDAAAARRETADLPWFGLDPHRGSDVWQTDLPSGAVLCLGAEGPGLSADVAQRVDHWVRIPMDGRVESLNVAVAAALVLFEWRRRSHSTAAKASETGGAPVVATTSE